MSTILDTQYFLINRDGYDYKVNALTLGQWVADSGPMPWEEHIENGSGGVFHIINLSDDFLYLSSGPYGTGENYGSYGPHQAYSPDGTDLGNICSVPPLEEVIILTGKNASGLFAHNPTIEWKFGPETNTTHITNMEFMFHKCDLFNADIADWNTGRVENMNSMFNGTKNFNQNLSQWCVQLIKSKPDRFDEDAVNWSGPKPGWGTCPGVEIMPWVGHDGGIWHIQNLRGDDLKVNRGWAGSLNPVQVYAMDGTDLGMLKVIPQTLGEFMVLSNGNESCLFNGAYDQFQFDFGPLTDTSKVVNFVGLIGYNTVINPAGMENFDTSNVICMHGTFEYCTAFDRDISGWDTSSVIQDFYQPIIPGPGYMTGMENMFFQAHAFNKDLSGWCVTNLTSAPSGFADDTPAWTLPKPVWGTCPRGEKMPWEGHDGGIWHIKNSTKEVKLQEYNGPYQAWTINGDDLGEIAEVPMGQELVFITGANVSELFELNLDVTWDFGEYTNTSRVIDMEYMFYKADKFNSDISGWDTSNVTNMTGMFGAAAEFNQNIGSWNVSSVIGAYYMFAGASVFNQDLSGWCVPDIDDEPNGFAEEAAAWVLPKPVWGTCPPQPDRPTPPNGPISPCTRTTPTPWVGHDGGIWHITNVTNKVALNASYTSWLPDGSDEKEINEVKPGEEVVFITPKNSSNLFKPNNANAKYEIGPLTNTSKVINMKGLFFNNKKFLGVGVEYIDTSNVTDLGTAFKNAYEFNGNISGWNTSKVKKMNSLFEYAQLFNQPINGWNTSSVTNMEGMFKSAEAFNQDINDWDVSNVNTMYQMFQRVVGTQETSFNQSLTNWDVSNVTNMTLMFCDAKAFNGDLSGWMPSNVTEMNSMFKGAITFNQDISGWDVSGCSEMSSMFYNAAKFNQDLKLWCVSKITKEPNFFTEGATSWTKPKPVWNTCPPRP